jgi:hypothetical protein
MFAVFDIVNNLNQNKYFWGITMLVMNLGGRYLGTEISAVQESVFMHHLFRYVILFCMFFMRTRDIFTALV